MRKSRPREDQTGKRFGRLLVIAYAYSVGKVAYWFVKCVCGTYKPMMYSNLKWGGVISCGCANQGRIQMPRKSRHRVLSYDSGAYKSWQNMKTKCLNRNRSNYAYYGERGHTICDRWLNSYANFHEDMGDRPEGRRLDKIDNYEGYSGDNCRWATHREQIENRRHSLRRFSL
jgi:hypothetical protein